MCRGNVGRSQIAEAIYNNITNSKDSNSAGTRVEVPNQKILEWKISHPEASFVIDVMKEISLDISKNQTIQLNKDGITKYDLIKNMAGKKYTPKWLEGSPNYIYWKVRDPMGTNHEVIKRTRDKIKCKVEELIKQKSELYIYV